jgi:membrane-bound metal-dependent hydrolase YbcI (DUF457 family)
MDPLTHVVVGRALTAAAGRPDRPQSFALGAAAILGALSPDIDSVVAFAGWDRYLRVHQFGTHSLLGTVVMAACTAGVIWLVHRGTGFAALLGAATAGAISHIALDLACGALIAIAWPLSYRRFSVPLVAMADPWLVGICAGGVFALWRVRVPMRTAARLVLVTISVFLAFKAAMLAMALSRADVIPAVPDALEARWGSLAEWTVYGRSADTVRSVRISSSGAPSGVVMSQAVESASPFVARSHELETVRNFLAAHDFAFPVVEPEGLDRISVLWSDLRYCGPASTPNLVSCVVWAGGIFDRSGRALTQEVKVGRLIQTRRPPG